MLEKKYQAATPPNEETIFIWNSLAPDTHYQCNKLHLSPAQVKSAEVNHEYSNLLLCCQLKLNMKSKWEKISNASKVIILSQQCLPVNAFYTAETESEVII